MKKIISVLLLATLLLTFVACGETTPPVDDISSTPIESDSPTSEVDDPIENFKYKHVIIVGIDGMGAYHKGANTPNIDSIFADYALTDVAQTYKPVSSGPCWLSMFTGVDPAIMRTNSGPDLKNSLLMQRYFEAVEKYPTLFTIFHNTYSDSKVACIARFEALDDVFASCGDYVYIAGTNPVKWTVQEELENALTYIETIDTSKNNFAFFYFNEPDATGHTDVYGSEVYNAKLTECDAALGEIFKAVEAKGMLDDTLFILATDHGGDGKSHGNIYTPPALTITLGFRGKTNTACQQLLF